jgi:hypothetical protein
MATMGNRGTTVTPVRGAVTQTQDTVIILESESPDHRDTARRADHVTVTAGAGAVPPRVPQCRREPSGSKMLRELRVGQVP